MSTDYKQYNYSAYYAGEPFPSSACGPTSCADILDISPLTTAQWLTNHGYAAYLHGTEWAGISACLAAYGAGGKMLASGLDGVTSHPAITQWQQSIQSGYCGVLLMHKVTSSYWTNGGHYIAVVGYKDGKYLVYDPASAARTGYHSWSDFSGNVCAIYTSTKRWSSSVTTYTFTPAQVQLGSNNKSVLLLQELLAVRGLYEVKLGLDGSFGNGTKESLIAYQKSRSSVLAVDGICGPNTWKDLLGRTATNVTLEQVKYGDTGDDVILLEKILRAQGMYLGEIDGVFGPGVQAGVKSAQSKFGIAVDGVCGPNTWKCLIGI